VAQTAAAHRADQTAIARVAHSKIFRGYAADWRLYVSSLIVAHWDPGSLLQSGETHIRPHLTDAAEKLAFRTALDPLRRLHGFSPSLQFRAAICSLRRWVRS
jgi:hypothetical protein